MASPAKSKCEPPDNCRGKLCEGSYLTNPEYAFHPIGWTGCPLDGPDCPFHKQRLLGPLGIGERYQSASLEKIPSEGARTFVHTYIDSIGANISAGKGLYVQGGVGTGKTSILALVAYAAASAGHSVVYWYAGELFNRLHRDDQEAMAAARHCDLLLLDDFGTQYAIDWTVTRFDSLIEYRYAHRKAMCVTTNASSEELENSDAWRRVYDRWKEMCEGISAGRKSMR